MATFWNFTELCIAPGIIQPIETFQAAIDILAWKYLSDQLDCSYEQTTIGYWHDGEAYIKENRLIRKELNKNQTQG